MFKRMLRRWLLEDDSPKLASAGYATAEVSRNSIEEDNTIRFTVTPARGGIVVSVRQYDAKTDRTNYTNHVIHDDDNVAESIGHIVSMEILRA